MRTRSLLQGRFSVHKGFSSKGKAAFNQAHNINQVNCAITCSSASRNGCFSHFGYSKRSISSMTPILIPFDPPKCTCTSNRKENVFEKKGIFLWVDNNLQSHGLLLKQVEVDCYHLFPKHACRVEKKYGITFSLTGGLSPSLDSGIGCRTWSLAYQNAMSVLSLSNRLSRGLFQFRTDLPK